MGIQGSGNGQLNLPFGIMVDSQDDVYVADTGNSRVQKFDSNGGFITMWGYYGINDGSLQNGPYGLVEGANDMIYVTDSTSVNIFSPLGEFVTKWGEPGTDNGEFFDPYGIAADTAGNVYTIENNNRRVQVFTSAGSFLTAWGDYAMGGYFETGNFFDPYGIALDADGYVYVSEAQGCQESEIRLRRESCSYEVKHYFQGCKQSWLRLDVPQYSIYPYCFASLWHHSISVWSVSGG